MLYVAVPVKNGSGITGYVRLAKPLHDVQSTIEKVYNSFFLAILIVAALSLIIALLFSYRLAAPIKAMERFTERLRHGHTSGDHYFTQYPMKQKNWRTTSIIWWMN